MTTFTYSLILVLLMGCASQGPLTPLERQVRKENLQRACRDAGGIWHATGQGSYGGECDWTPLL